MTLITKLVAASIALACAATSSYAYDSTCSALFQEPPRKVFFTPERKTKAIKLAIALPVTIAISSLFWKKVDENYFWPKVESSLTEKILTETEAKYAFYDKLVERDFRFRRIKEMTIDVKAAEIDDRLKNPAVQKRMLAFNLAKNYELYYLRYRSLSDPNHLTLKKNVELFGKDPLFEHLNFFFENGTKQYEGTKVDPKLVGPITDEQKNKIYMLTHDLYTKYALIDLAFQKNDQAAVSRSEVIRAIRGNGYTEDLLKLVEQKKINRDELVYYLQEDAYYQYYFSVFEILHIVNLKFENGKYINEPLTLADMRADRMKTILRHNYDWRMPND